MVHALKTLTFVYVQREDRVMAAVNAGHADAWSCWLTRRLSLAILERAPQYIESKSDLTQRAPANLRAEMASFEREAAIAKTAGAMSVTPPEILQQSANVAGLADRLSITQQGEGFRFELLDLSGNGAAAVFRPTELQRVLQMLQGEVVKAIWVVPAAHPQTAAASADPKLLRN
ncbi:MAG TPA: hypothetical protein VH206_08515 [Xanthobacteraceae bacterium]|jgi:hypothetical protein|nr:hypothetical protein [Xanthobacteraceae bacterium]